LNTLVNFESAQPSQSDQFSVGVNNLVPTLELIKTAVLNGELDIQIDAAANKLRDGFAQ
jgi:hypothetical protein